MPKRMNKTERSGRSPNPPRQGPSTSTSTSEEYVDSLDYDFAYQRYLEAMMAKHEQDHVLAEKEKQVEQHLMKRLEELHENYDELLSLEEQIEELNLKSKVTDMKKKFKHLIDELHDVLTPQLLHSCEKVCEILNNKLQHFYMNNLKELKSAEDIAKFNDLLLECTDLLASIKDMMPKKEVLQDEAAAMREYKGLEEDYFKKKDDVAKLDDAVSTLTLKSVSDKLSHVE